MKRHLCRHCGLALDTYAELTRHVASHLTPVVTEHTYSVAQPIDLATRQSERNIRVNAMQRLRDRTICSIMLGPYVVLAVALAVAVI